MSELMDTIFAPAAGLDRWEDARGRRMTLLCRSIQRQIVDAAAATGVAIHLRAGFEVSFRLDRLHLHPPMMTKGPRGFVPVLISSLWSVVVLIFCQWAMYALGFTTVVDNAAPGQGRVG